MIVKEYGFCHGVQLAIKNAQDCTASNVYMYGNLVNNSSVMAEFTARGYTVVENVESIPANSTVIVRAHGIGQQEYAAMQAKNANIIDCTCSKIKKIHTIVQKESARGAQIFIIGKKNHPEVVGICGWCDNATVLETDADLALLPAQGDICVVGQTTCKRDWWQQATCHIKQAYPHANIHSTLCNAVTDRLNKAANIAKDAAHTIVVGDISSANSVELHRTCARMCESTVFVRGVQDLPIASISKCAQEKNICLVGSTSTPAGIVDTVYDAINFACFFQGEAAAIENTCNTIFKQALSDATHPITTHAITDLMDQNKGGKRIRGALIQLGHNIAANETAPASIIPAAYEIFQTAILIHDDIIDRSNLRRGRTTIHNLHEDPHFGLARAICIGDYGFFLVNHLIANAKLDNDTKVRLMQHFSKVQITTLEGELIDVTLPHQNIDPTTEEYHHAVTAVNINKTAWYTIVGPLILGAVCGGASQTFLSQIEEMAVPLGIAFQIRDDLLGIYGTTQAIGKPAISDIVEKKQTLLYGYAAKHASPAQLSRLAQLYGNPAATMACLEEVREIFTKTGARAHALEEIQNLSDISLAKICNLPIHETYKSLLNGLVLYLTTREN